MMKRIQKKGLFFHEVEDEKRKAGRVASKDGEISEVFLNGNEGRKMYAADARNHPDVIFYDRTTVRREDVQKEIGWILSYR